MRRALVAAAAIGVVALAGTMLLPGTAHGDADFTCQGGFSNPASGTYKNVIVPSTANSTNFCFMNGATVTKNVTVQPGGAVLIANSTIGRDFTSPSAGTAAGGLYFSVAMSGSTVGHNLSVSGSSSLVEIGTDDYGNNCVGTIAPNTLNGSNNISNNQGGVEVEGNHVNGDLTVNNNSGLLPGGPNGRDFDASPGATTAVNNNSDSRHQLSCSGNAGVVDSSNNTFKTVLGQCNP